MCDEFSFNKRNGTRKSVLITGFLPFNEYKMNPSWEGVKLMKQKEIENKYNIILTKEKIAVEYDEVDRIVPELWDTCKPDLAIHVGLNEAVSCLVLEDRANKYGYDAPDTVKKHAPCKMNNSCGADTITTKLDVKAIRDEFNCNCCNPSDKLRARVSRDASRYLCEYIYYTSLCRSPTTLFVHVPLVEYTPEELAKGLERILELCLKQF